MLNCLIDPVWGLDFSIRITKSLLRKDWTFREVDMPQGGIDLSELPEEAAMRELKEEIDTDHAEIIDRTEDWLCYDLPANLTRKVFKGKYRGQKQLWYAMRFKGEDSEINLHKEKPEFVEWKWVKLKSITEMVIPF